jgi:hypothetical protein
MFPDIVSPDIPNYIRYLEFLLVVNGEDFEVYPKFFFHNRAIYF